MKSTKDNPDRNLGASEVPGDDDVRAFGQGLNGIIARLHFRRDGGLGDRELQGVVGQHHRIEELALRQLAGGAKLSSLRGANLCGDAPARHDAVVGGEGRHNASLR